MVILLKNYKWTSIWSKNSTIEKQEIPSIVVQYSEFSQNCSWYPVPTALHLLKSSNFTLSKWSTWHNEYPATLPDYDDDAKTLPSM